MPILKYNNVDFNPSVNGIVFAFPFISRSKNSENNSGLQVNTDTYTLDGQFYLTTPDSLSRLDSDNDGINDGVESLMQAMLAIQNFFGQSHKKLETDFGTVDTAIVRSIDFQPNNWSGLISYVVELEGTRTETQESVLDIVDEFTITESESGSHTISHKVSARGINTSTGNGSNAFTNAKAWVTNRLWNNNLRLGSTLAEIRLSPSLGGNSSWGANPPTVGQKVPPYVLLDINESTNRMSASYSVTEKFEYVDSMWTDLLDLDPTGPTGDESLATSINDGRRMITKYSFDTSYDQARFCTVLSVDLSVRYSNLDDFDLNDVMTYLGGDTTTYDNLAQRILDKIRNSDIAPIAFKDRETNGIGVMNVYANSLKSATIDPDSGTVTIKLIYDNDPKMFGIANTNNFFF